MPPPNDRRPGFSKRAQFSIFTAYVAAGAGLLAGAVLIGIAVVDPGSFAFLRRGANEVAAPVGVVGSVSRARSRGVFERIGDYIDAGNKNAALRREVAVAPAAQAGGRPPPLGSRTPAAAPG